MDVAVHNMVVWDEVMVTVVPDTVEEIGLTLCDVVREQKTIIAYIKFFENLLNAPQSV